MAVDAGTVYAEIRVGLDKLQGDMAKVDQLFVKSGTAIDRQNKQTETSTQGMTQKVTASFKNMSKSGINQFANMAKGINAAFMALPIIGLITMVVGAIKGLVGGIGKFLNETADAYTRQQKELMTLQSIIVSTGAASWTTANQLENMAKKLSDSTGVATNDIIKMQTRLLTYNNIVGENFDRAQQAALDMAAVMGMDVSSAAETLGKALDSPIEGLTALTRQGFRFSAQTKEQIQQLTDQGRIAEAQAVILKQVETAYKGAAAAQAEALGVGKKLENAQEALRAELGRSTSAFVNWVNGIKLSITEARLASARFRNLGKDVADSDEKVKNLTMTIDELKRRFAETSDNFFLDQIEQQTIEQFNEQIKAATGKVALLSVQFKTAKERYDDLLEQEGNSRISTELFEKQKATMKLNLDNLHGQIIAQEQLLQIQKQKQIAAVANQIYSAKELADTKEIEKLTNQILDIQNKRNQALAIARSDRDAERIDQEEYEKRVQTAYTEEASQLTTLKVLLQNLATQSTIGDEKRVQGINDVVAALKMATAEELNQRDILKTIDDTETRKKAEKSANDILIDQDIERRILLLQRRGDLAGANEIENKIADTQLKQSDNYRNLLKGLKEGTKEYEDALALQQKLLESTQQLRQEQAETGINKKLQDMNDQYMKIKGSVKAVNELEKKRAWEAIQNTKDYQDATEKTKIKVEEAFNKMWEASHSKNPWQKLAEGVNKYGSQVAGIISAGLQIWSDSVQQETQILLTELDKRYAALREALEKEKQERLYALGYAEAATEEQHQRELELAIESGDQQRMYAAQDAYEKFKIEEEFAQKQKALDEQQARDKAELEYKAALAQWNTQLLNAIVSGAQAIAMAGVNMWPVPAIPMMALAGALTAAQIGIVAANKPKMQTFAEGGIVLGNSFRGDNILTRQNSGEMDLNMRQQKNLFNRIDNDELGGDVNVTIPISLDGMIIAKAVVDKINRRQYLIEAGSVV